jgi:hypothetical protein
MLDREAKPEPTDDPETAERKSLTVDERVPAREGPDLVPGAVLPGAVGPYVPQAGIGRESPLGDDLPGPGELVLEQERKAQRTPTQRG